MSQHSFSVLVTPAPRSHTRHYISRERGRTATSPRRTSAPDMALKRTNNTTTNFITTTTTTTPHTQYSHHPTHGNTPTHHDNASQRVLQATLIPLPPPARPPVRPRGCCSADRAPLQATPSPPPPTLQRPLPHPTAHPSQCWNVKDDPSGNDYGHQESRDGYDTQGSYYVQLPDGRLQEVTLHSQRRLRLRGPVTIPSLCGQAVRATPSPPSLYKQTDRQNSHQSPTHLSPDMALKLVLLSALVAAALADRAPLQATPSPTTSHPTALPAPSYSAPQPVSPPKYDFSWNVKDDPSGNDYGHQEGRNGYDTQGSYYVQLPDGRLQEVTYTVNGDSGFVAQVNYQGEAQYPTQQGYGSAPSYQAPAPSYQQPRPSYA
ncbi:hypothetical protein O3P69_014712 [Scylla paramamosain]|uniref:Pro-resilin n=1 Tax=Scylla paramamosain TaxID=85552 RepID=A0AAW0TXN6_SCYPA